MKRITWLAAVIGVMLAALAVNAFSQPTEVPVSGEALTAPVWGNNVQVTAQSVYAFDVDYRNNGEMYLGMICPAAARDTFKVLRSTDGGASWSPFRLYLSNEHRKYTDIALVCGKESLLVFVPQDTARGAMRCYLGRFGYAGGDAWSYFADTSYTQAARGIIVSVDADRSAGGDTLIAACVADSLGTITGFTVMRSLNRGATWGRRFAAAAGRSARVTWVRDRKWAIVFKNYYGALSRKHTDVYVTTDDYGTYESVRVDSTAYDTLNVDPSITACRSTGRALVAVTHQHPSTGGDIVVYRSLDDGDTTYQQVMAFAPGDDQFLPALNCSRFGTSGWIDLAYVDDYGDCVGYFTSQYGDNGSWGTHRIISDRPASVTTASKIAYCLDGSHSGPAVFYAGSDGNGIYMNAEWVMGVAGSSTPLEVPSGLHLLPNAPNPFSQKTTIRYQLTRPGKVSLKVYNLAGQCVKDLTPPSPPLDLSAEANAKEEGRDSWVGSVVWDGRDERGVRVSNGVYVCWLEAREGSQSRKMVLMR